MEFTGERFIPAYEGSIEAEHYNRYFFAQPLVLGKDVLDIASGEGYGSNILARGAKSVIGMDISEEAVAHAKERYQLPNLSYRLGDAAKIPLPDNGVDVVTSFETLEHLESQGEMIGEIRRVLRKNGLLVISTPNKPVFDKLGPNSFHVRELELAEFKELLHGQFANVAIFGQNCLYGSIIEGNNGHIEILSWKEGASEAERASFLEKARYYIALASDAEIPKLPASVFGYPEAQSDAALELKREIARMAQKENEMRLYIEELEGHLKARDQELAKLGRNLETRGQELAIVVKELENMLNSRSWRLTKPLRSLFALGRRIRGEKSRR